MLYLDQNRLLTLTPSPNLGDDLFRRFLWPRVLPILFSAALTEMTKPIAPPDSLTHIDLFAGCGGLSLGLHQAGWQGLFAVERSPMAFGTLKHNLIDGPANHYTLWPEWLPKEACSIQKLTKDYRAQLKALQETVTLVAGGPPCQGFSYAGKRQKYDPRNQLYRSYMEVVALVRPKIVLLENVIGIASNFEKKTPGRRGRAPEPYSKRIERALGKLRYDVRDIEVLASDYGVPQSRVRFIAVGINRDVFPEGTQAPDLSKILGDLRLSFLASHGLPQDKAVSCSDALSDLEYDEKRLADCPDTKNYKAGMYATATTGYQKLMRGTITNDVIADSHRFVKHRAKIVTRFSKILDECPRGKNLSDTFRKENGIKKACIVPLDPEKPSSTLTTIPDDMIHYSQPRVMTVRECARLQSFPDWFAIRDKYTTGGSRRKVECPRYTQVGNAVPPLLGEALGLALASWVHAQRTDPAGASHVKSSVVTMRDESPMALEVPAFTGVS